MLEGVLDHRVERLPVDEARADQGTERVPEFAIRKAHDPLQQRLGEARADHRCGLEQTLCRLPQPIDARRQHRPHRGGHLEPGDRTHQPAAVVAALENPRIQQGGDHLLDEERVSGRSLADLSAQRHGAGVATQELVQELFDGRIPQRCQGERRVAGLPHPGRGVLRAEVGQHQGASLLGDLDQALEKRLTARIDPVQVFE
jgi:hypothetical protein